MGLDDFLAEKADQGELDSNGQFTLDLRRASELLKELAHNDAYFSFLKLVQVAHRLGAERLDFVLSYGRMTACFETSEVFELDDLGGIVKAASDLEATVSPLVSDLRGALLGGSQLGSSVTWTVVSRGQARHLIIEESGKVSMGLDSPHLGAPAEPNQRACHFSVQVKSGWQFWKVGGRLRKLKDLLSAKCAFSQVNLYVNRQEIERADSSILNSHLREFLGSEFNAAIGAAQLQKTKVAFSNLLVELADEGLSVFRPERKSYTQQGEHLLWSHGLRGDNTLRPDSDESPAWMLQYLGEDLEHKNKLVCRCAIAFNIHGPGNQESVRIKVVRHGVTLMESQLKGGDLENFRGCTILFHDEYLPTDLSGLKLVEGEELVRRVMGFAPLIESGHDYFLAAAEKIHWA